MDINNLDLNAAAGRGILVRLRNPATQEALGTEKEPCRIGVYGSDSDKWKQADKRLKSERAEPLKMLSGDEQTAHTLAVLAECTFLVENLSIGETEYTPANILELYKRVGYHWVYEQVLMKAQSRAELDIAKKSLPAG